MLLPACSTLTTVCLVIWRFWPPVLHLPGVRLAICERRKRDSAPVLPAEMLLEIFAQLRDMLEVDPMVQLIVQGVARPELRHTALPPNTRGLLTCALTCRSWTSCALEVLHWHIISKDSAHICTLAGRNTSDSSLAQAWHLDMLAICPYSLEHEPTSHWHRKGFIGKSIILELSTAPVELVTLFSSARRFATVRLAIPSKAEFMYILSAVDMLQLKSFVAPCLFGNSICRYMSD